MASWNAALKVIGVAASKVSFGSAAAPGTARSVTTTSTTAVMAAAPAIREDDRFMRSPPGCTTFRAADHYAAVALALGTAPRREPELWLEPYQTRNALVRRAVSTAPRPLRARARFRRSRRR